MGRRWSVCVRDLVVSVILLGIASRASVALCADEHLAKGTLSGTVIDSYGKAVTGARVSLNGSEFDRATLTASEKLIAEATAGADGRFRLGPLAAEYRPYHDLRIEAEGFAPQYIAEYSIFENSENDLGAIRLDRGRVFTGQVLDVDGKPRVGATIHCEVKRYTLGHTVNDIKPANTLTTDDEGRFRTPPMTIGHLVIHVQEPERQLAYRMLPVGPEGEEALAEPIQLENDVPIVGWVRDQHGRPVEGAAVRANSEFRATSDADGKFTLRGFGPRPRFQMHLMKEGYVFINWGVNVSDEGFRCNEVGKPTPIFKTLKDFIVPLERSAWIEGRAVDAESGEPVKLDKVILCTFTRKPDGEVIVGGCRASNFEQPTTGHFRVEYSRPDEYHLTFSAAGYHDAEAFTPLVKELQPVDGLVVKLKRDAAGTKVEIQKQTITGIATRDGMPIKSGWAGLWTVRRQRNTVNAYILRGRTTVGDPVTYERAPIRDGAYTLDVPFQAPGYYVVVEEPGHAPTQVGPFDIKVNEEKHFNISCVAGGGVSGQVENVPDEWKGNMWVVAFTKTAIQTETRIDVAGAFRFDHLPPGQYGLKVGHDAYRDSEVPRELKDVPKEVWNKLPDPWKRATLVTVESDQTTEGVRLELPKD